MKIDLDDNIGDSKFFRWGEALYLPQWDIDVFPDNDLIALNIEKTAIAMDKIRDFFNVPLKVTSWYRPGRYNRLIGGAMASAHISGLACDFMVQNMKSQEARRILFPKLVEFNIRMENLETPHVHIDLKCGQDMDINKRYFKP
jgi:hypothetical protein